jgi:hypothetical protein
MVKVQKTTFADYSISHISIVIKKLSFTSLRRRWLCHSNTQGYKHISQSPCHSLQHGAKWLVGGGQPAMRTIESHGVQCSCAGGWRHLRRERSGKKKRRCEQLISLLYILYHKHIFFTDSPFMLRHSTETWKLQIFNAWKIINQRLDRLHQMHQGTKRKRNVMLL